jgi:hypothetical protein
MRWHRSVLFLGLFLSGFTALADDATVTPVPVLQNLDNPWAVAIQPETGVVYLSESGAGRIIRVADGKPETVVSGFSVEAFGSTPAYKIGPLGLAFQDKTTLIVGDGGLPSGEDLVRTFVLDELSKLPLDFDKRAKHKLGPLPADDGQKAEGNFFAIAATRSALFVGCNGEDKSWLAKAEVSGSSFGELQRWIPVKETTGSVGPTALVANPQTGDLVVGLSGSTDVPGDAVLAFFNAKSGKLLMKLNAGLNDISGLAYSPKTGLLYAVDASWREPTAGGLYRLDAAFSEGKQSIHVIKISPLDRPTALAFDEEGTLYLTALGSQPKAGKLMKCAGGL